MHVQNKNNEFFFALIIFKFDVWRIVNSLIYSENEMKKREHMIL
jgi:hypothetical protein